MKTIATLTAVLAIGAASIAPALADVRAAPICLQTRQIDRTTVVNPKTILFRMKDGKVFRSDMRTSCLSLKYNGFVYVTHADEICGGSQSIRVLNTDEVCLLGKFTPDTIGQHS